MIRFDSIRGNASIKHALTDIQSGDLQSAPNLSGPVDMPEQRLKTDQRDELAVTRQEIEYLRCLYDKSTDALGRTSVN